MQVEQVSYETSDSQAYGFIVYNRSGYSLPKGMYSSYVAHYHNQTDYQNEYCYIEFSIASPTGDASDHHNYTYPCANFAQAKKIVEMHGHMVNMWIMENTPV
jgi:hypothetical protein